MVELPKLKQMREKVLKELEHIPGWPKPQKDLRMVYWFSRMHSLGKKAKVRKSAKALLDECIEYLRKHGGAYLQKDNDHEFQYDKEFFQSKKGNNEKASIGID